MAKFNSIENKINSDYKEELKTLSEENGTLDEIATADFQLNKDEVKRNDRGYLIINNNEQGKIKAGLISNKYNFEGIWLYLISFI